MCIGTEITYYTNYSLIVIYMYRTEVFHLLDDVFQIPGIIHSQRNSYLRRRNHIDRCFIPFKYLEYLAQEAISQQHTGRVDMDGRNSIFGSNRSNLPLASTILAYQCACCLWIHRVQ